MGSPIAEAPAMLEALEDVPEVGRVEGALQALGDLGMRAIVGQRTSQGRLADGAHTTGSGALAEDGDIVGIATKPGDVLLDPLQRLDLVEDAEKLPYFSIRYVTETLEKVAKFYNFLYLCTI